MNPAVFAFHRLHLAMALFVAVCCNAIGVPAAVGQTAFRTDTSDDDSLPWYTIEPGKFPPPGSAHAFSGELIGVDHVNRTGTLRVDRTDAQRRSHWDLPIQFTMLPYGSIEFHGAPAALMDIPLGTHLHGKFYHRAADEDPSPTVFHGRASIEADFTRCFQLQDDFSYYSSLERAFRIDAIDLETKKLTVTEVNADGSEPAQKSLTLDLLDSTRVWKDRSIAELDDLAAGQIVLLNLTWATLYGPGRCLDIWVDETSRQIARRQQLAVHQQYQRQRGLAGWIDAVDNQKKILTVTLFGGVAPDLFDDFQEQMSITCVVAEPSLRTYDQVNDRKGGTLFSIREIDLQPGSSGVQFVFDQSLLLEGHRPGRIVRLFAPNWPIIALPQEETLFPARD